MTESIVLLDIFTPFRDLSFTGLSLRIALSVLCGGMIGLEREHRRRSAGFRTHILICLGAAIASSTNLYLGIVMHYHTDIARMGAQVIAGVSFIGAGAIIMTKNKRVKGLTTAAGLWVSAIIGLCCGSGFYEGAILATALVLIAEIIFSEIEYNMVRRLREMSVYVEYSSCLEEIMNFCREQGLKVTDVRVISKNENRICAIFMLQTGHATNRSAIVSGLSSIRGVFAADDV